MYRRNRTGIFDRITKYELRNYIDNFEDKGISLRSFKEYKNDKKLEITFMLLGKDLNNTLIISTYDDNPKATVEFINWPSAAPVSIGLDQLDILTDFVQFCEARDMLVLLRALYPGKETKKHVDV